MQENTSLQAIRRHLHSHPELSGKEFETAKYVADFLRLCSPRELHEGIGGTGIWATFEADEPGKHIAFRCELDALPIQEINDFEHASQTPKVSHKCGHDGHIAILMGLAKHLKNNPLQRGKVSLIFQPAEENGEGAKAMLSDVDFKNAFQPDFMYALHNVPGQEMHKVMSKADVFTPSVISIKIHFQGKTSHAAEPEMGINPAKAIAEIILELDSLQQPNKDANDFALIAVVESTIGSAWYGISAGEGCLGLTLRSWNNIRMEILKKDVVSLCQRCAAKHQLSLSFEYFDEFRANINHAYCHQTIARAAKALNFAYQELPFAFKWGEDFGLFTEYFPGAMFALGSGVNTPALHNPDYDFPDELIDTGVQLFAKIAEIHLNE